MGFQAYLVRVRMKDKKTHMTPQICIGKHTKQHEHELDSMHEHEHTNHEPENQNEEWVHT
jgi:ABC-type nickel/cobalt efflux system permease component RcnA